MKNPSVASNSLLEKIRTYSDKYPSYKFLVIFDGFFEGVSIPHPKITTIFSYNQTADNIIKEQIKNSLTTKHLTIISSDAEVLSYGRIYACEIFTSEEFLFLLNPKEQFSTNTAIVNTKEKPSHTSKKEMDFFLNAFK